MFFHKVRRLLELVRPPAAAGPLLRPYVDEAAWTWPFTEAAVDLSPAGPGVFFLYSMGRLVYIGVAVRGSSIREELASHLRGAHGICTQQATAFICEPSVEPLRLHSQYLEQHRVRYGGRLPACNPR
jgi:hypothetical protein